MKLDALDHPKTYDLASRLEVSRPTAIGHLELLWAFTGKLTPQGNVGKWPDGAIARSCDWMGPPEDFINALIESGFLDRDSEHRLTVHDWSHHAQSWVRAKLKNSGLSFIETAISTKGPTREPTREATRGPPREPTKGPTTRAPVPSEAKRSEEKPSQAHSDARARERDPVPSETTEPESEWERNHRFALTEIRAAYPTNIYTETDWQNAARTIAGRITGGEVTREDLLQLVHGFAAQQDAKGNRDTQYVENPCRHFDGRGKWRGPFELPAAPKPKLRNSSASAHITWTPED